MKEKNFRTDKFLLYILGKLLAVGLGIMVMVFAFSTVMASSNIYILAKDAFAKRTSVIWCRWTTRIRIFCPAFLPRNT